MIKRELYERLNTVSVEISVHVKEFISRTDAYLSSFDSISLLSFSDNKSKLYKENYYEFFSSLTEVAEHLTSAISKLSTLLEIADNESELEIIVSAGSKLEAFFKFENSLGEFSKATKKLISSESISPSQLVFEARKLRSAAESFELNFSDQL